MFAQYFDLGFDHILHKDAIDHILFILVLCALYKIQDWKKLLMLVTAFTIGHSVTLVLVSLEKISVTLTTGMALSFVLQYFALVWICM